MRRRFPSRLAASALASGLIALFSACSEDAQQAPPPPPTVEVVPVQQADVPLYHDWVCTLSADVTATISAQVTGYLKTRTFEEGSQVKAGQVLFQIDPAPFAAVLDQAKAQVEEAQARETKCQQDVTRYTPLAAVDAISQQELDDAIQSEKAARAQVDGAKAAVASAQLNLSFTTITSPVDGIVGLAKAQIGDLVGPGSGALTTVVKTSPIRAYFSVSQALVSEILERRLESGQPLMDASTDGPPLQLFLTGTKPFPETGRILFHDNQIDVKTGTVTMVGEFANAHGLLVSGMFGRLRGLIGVDKDALLVPAKAVTDMQSRYLVAVVDEDDKVSIRVVTVTLRLAKEWVIQGQLKAGDRVITEGLQKVKDGMAVTPVPPPQAAPPVDLDAQAPVETAAAADAPADHQEHPEQKSE